MPVSLATGKELNQSSFTRVSHAMKLFSGRESLQRTITVHDDLMLSLFGTISDAFKNCLLILTTLDGA